MLKVLSNILCDLDPKVKVIGQKAGICDGVPSTSALVIIYFIEKKKKIWGSVCVFLRVTLLKVIVLSRFLGKRYNI